MLVRVQQLPRKNCSWKLIKGRLGDLKFNFDFYSLLTIHYSHLTTDNQSNSKLLLGKTKYILLL